MFFRSGAFLQLHFVFLQVKFGNIQVHFENLSNLKLKFLLREDTHKKRVFLVVRPLRSK